MWRGSWRFFHQGRQCRRHPPSSPQMGLIRLQLRSFNGSPAPLFCSAAEVEISANSAEAEATSSVEDVEKECTDGSPAQSVSAISTNFEEEHGERALMKALGGYRQLVSALRTELEEHKNLTKSLLEGVSVLTSKVNTKPLAETEPLRKKIRWPEWTAFLELLQDSHHFKYAKGTPLSNDSGSIFENLGCVQAAIQDFSQAHESIFQNLSQIDLRILARHGCTANDPVAAASKKILRQHFHISDDKVEDGQENLANIQPKLSDVTRLLHFSILEGTAEEDLVPSVRYLLREIVALSRKSSEARSSVCLLQSAVNVAENTMHAKNTESSKPERVLDEKNAKSSDTFSKGETSRLGKEGAKQESKAPPAPQWRCPRCAFVNLDTKHRCVECSRRRPQSTFTDNPAKAKDNLSAADECTEEQASKPSDKTKERGNVKHQALAVSDSESENRGNSDIEKSAKTKDPFDVLDDILDSSEYDENESVEEPKKEKGKGGGRKSPSLSGLFSRPPKKDNDRRNDSAMSGRRTFRGSPQLSRDPKRRISLSTDEDESILSDTDMPSGKGENLNNDDYNEDYDDEEGHARRYGKARRGSGRGGGGRRNWNDSHDDRSSDRGFKGAREFHEREKGSRFDSFSGREAGERDRRSRSDSFGSRPMKARSR